MKKFLILLITITYAYTHAQVGIGTTNPQTDLDIEARSTAPGEFNGVLIPRVTAIPTNVAPAGTLIYVNTGTDAGFYYSNGVHFMNVGNLSVQADTGTSDNLAVIQTDANAADQVTISGGNGISVSESGNMVSVTESENFVIHAMYSNDFGVNNTGTGSNRDVIRWFRLNYDNEITTTTEYNAGTFTASTGGYYYISAHIQSTFGANDGMGNGLQDFYGLAIYKNGIRIQATQGRNSEFDDFIRRSVTGLHYLDIGDTIEIYLGFPETFGNFNNIESDFSELIIKKLD